MIQPTLLGKTLSTVVLDEADLLLLHEYEGDLQAIAPQVCRMPESCMYVSKEQKRLCCEKHFGHTSLHIQWEALGAA